MAATAQDPQLQAAGAELLQVVVTNERLPKEVRAGQPNIDLDQAPAGSGGRLWRSTRRRALVMKTIELDGAHVYHEWVYLEGSA